MESIDQIIKIEWEMFQRTQNIGGRASCQEDYKTFQGMRSSQFAAWSEVVRLYYLGDLQEAEGKGRNLVAEKYLRMMEFTFPEEYKAQKQYLLPLTERQKWYADTICKGMIEETVILREQFPLVGNAGRPLHSYEDGAYDTSVETYQRGELYSYSETTLHALYEYIKTQKVKGSSIAKEMLTYTMKNYGYASLEEAEGALQQK